MKAMESDFTTQLRKLWDDIEMVCRGGSRPKEMSDAVHDDCRNEDVEVSPAESPTLDEERGEGDAQFSSWYIPHVLENWLDKSTYVIKSAPSQT
ncbi:hypothetical protein Ocin01_05642 [Orchesella cincta]|uniref:Uncharacterized protein n=1 Tax=Orchesella cincta TaxID=48709 RepID=A0A1D2N7T0_ORCCI|nr:hypothetical protein Ocin01_05642 [Orchesella cincta]